MGTTAYPGKGFMGRTKGSGEAIGAAGFRQQVPHASCHTEGRGGAFVRGQCRGGNFVFQFGVEIFPAELFCAIWGPSCSLCILSGGGSQVLQV